MSDTHCDPHENTRMLKSGETLLGVRCDSRIDGRAGYWSWGCKCGEWDDCIPSRKQARMEHKEHREKHCSLLEV